MSGRPVRSFRELRDHIAISRRITSPSVVVGGEGYKLDATRPDALSGRHESRVPTGAHPWLETESYNRHRPRSSWLGGIEGLILPVLNLGDNPPLFGPNGYKIIK